MNAANWGIAILMIVAVSWAFFHYFAPKNWRDWVGRLADRAIFVLDG